MVRIAKNKFLVKKNKLSEESTFCVPGTINIIPNQPAARFWQIPLTTVRMAFLSLAFTLISLSFLFFLPVPVFALCPDSSDPSCFGSSPVQTPKQWLTGFNPVPGLPTGDLTYITGKLAPFVIQLLIFLVIVLSLIFLIIGGISLMTSGGNKEGTAKAKGTITYAIIGLVLGLGSFIILNAIGQFLTVKFF